MNGITVERFLDDAGRELQLRLVAGASGLGRTIANHRVQKHGLVMAGFFENVHPERLIVFGATELQYFDGLDRRRQEEVAEGIFSREIACAVVTKGLEVPGPIREAADRHGRPLLLTPLLSSTFIVKAQDYLADALTARASIHGVLLDVFGVGVLLLGKSGIGKSECALDLVMRGHRLVADDLVEILRRKMDAVYGSGSPKIRYHMEIRGLGILNIQNLFGVAAVRERKKIELIMELVEWDPGMEYDRLGLDAQEQEILGVRVPKLTVPVRPGRNMSTIVEVAARNQLLKQQGYDAARSLLERLEGKAKEEAVDEIE